MARVRLRGRANARARVRIRGRARARARVRIRGRAKARARVRIGVMARVTVEHEEVRASQRSANGLDVSVRVTVRGLEASHYR